MSKSRKSKGMMGHEPSGGAAEGMGMGDYNGVGIKNKIGRIVKGYGVNPVKEKGLKKAPRSLA